MSIAQEEIFGPVLALIKVENLEEALQKRVEIEEEIIVQHTL